MMMENPIPAKVWNVLFHSTVAVVGGTILYSLWKEDRDARSLLNKPFAAIKASMAEPATQLAALKAIYDTLITEKRNKKGCSRLGAFDHAKLLVQCLKYEPDGSRDACIELTCKIVKECFAVDIAGKQAWHAARGYHKMMSLIAAADQNRSTQVLVTAANTLKLLTDIEDDEIVLQCDIPEGSEGTAQLAEYESSRNMLRTLERPDSIAYVVAATGIFANFCVLHNGAKKIGPGLDRKTAAHFFLPLLNHGNGGIVQHAATCLRYLLRAGFAHEELALEQNVVCVAHLLSLNTDPKTAEQVLSILRLLYYSPSKDAFFSILVKRTDALQAMFTLWCASDQKLIRDRAESLVHTLEHYAICTSEIKKLFEINRGHIQERQAKDEDLKRKAAQEQQQRQRALQQLMMMQMGGGGGGGGGEGDDPMGGMMGMGDE